MCSETQSKNYTGNQEMQIQSVWNILTDIAVRKFRAEDNYKAYNE